MLFIFSCIFVAVFYVGDYDSMAGCGSTESFFFIFIPKYDTNSRNIVCVHRVSCIWIVLLYEQFVESQNSATIQTTYTHIFAKSC